MHNKAVYCFHLPLCSSAWLAGLSGFTFLTDDLCPFGDDPVLLTAGSNCSERVNLSRGDCYDQSFHARCCQSCAAVRHHLPGKTVMSVT